MILPNNPALVGPYRCGRGEPLLLIAGPCVLQNETALPVAERLAEITASFAERGTPVQTVFKGSFDKANRSSLSGWRGLGIDEGLRLLEKVKTECGLPVTTDIHEPPQAEAAGQVCDLIQIPAFLARQTDLLLAAAATGRAVHVKKGQFMAPEEMRNVVEKLTEGGTRNILLGERGTFFGYGRLVNDFRSLVIMRSFGVPVVFDATHSVQEPGGLGTATGGRREFVAPLARAAAAVGIDALFLETLPDPSCSPSDAANILPLAELPPLLERVLAVRQAAE